MGAEGVPSQRRFAAGKELEAQVKQRVGFNTNKFWVKRDFDGGGYAEQIDLKLEAQEFPAYLLTEDWSDPVHAKIASDYINWIAPSLLTLQQINDDQRVRLEKHLYIQAVSVEYHWHLYPVIDEKILRSARVQSQLQKQQVGK